MLLPDGPAYVAIERLIADAALAQTRKLDYPSCDEQGVQTKQLPEPEPSHQPKNSAEFMASLLAVARMAGPESGIFVDRLELK